MVALRSRTEHHGGMAATSADYTWIADWGSGLFENAYCLTLIRDVEPDRVLDRLRADDRRAGLSIDDVSEASHDVSAASYEVAGHVARQFVGVTVVGAWAVMLENNGSVGITRALMLPVSAGTSVIAHYRNVNAVDRFMWIEDGVVRVEFEPLSAFDRSGSDADGIAAEMSAAGFSMSAEDDPDVVHHHTAAAFALGERLTGVRITPALLDSATFIGGTVSL